MSEHDATLSGWSGGRDAVWDAAASSLAARSQDGHGHLAIVADDERDAR